MNKRPLANCPGCKLLVKKLADDFDIKITPNELPSLINSVIQEDNEVKQNLSKVRHNYTVLDAEKTGARGAVQAITVTAKKWANIS